MCNDIGDMTLGQGYDTPLDYDNCMKHCPDLTRGKKSWHGQDVNRRADRGIPVYPKLCRGINISHYRKSHEIYGLYSHDLVRGAFYLPQRHSCQI